MSGIERLFFDTNAAIALLSGDAALLALWRQAKWAGLSVSSRALKLPDAIILASARVSGATLISRDARLAKAAEEAGIGVWHE